MDSISVGDLLGQGKAKRTAREYVRILRRAEAFMAARGVDLLCCDAVDVVEFADTLVLSHSTRAHLRGALLAAWEVLGRPDGPVRAVKVPPAPPAQCRAVDAAVAARLEAAAWKRADDPGLAVLIGLYAALRRAEIAGFHSDHVTEVDELGRPTWLRVIGKRDKTRELPIHPVLAAAIMRANKTGFFFPGRWGGPCNPDTIWRWTRQVSVEAGLRIPPHVLRHTSLAEANDRTGDLRAVQTFAGHARPETTAIYTRTTRATLARVVGSIDYGHLQEVSA